jgi:7-carboxy-7-deazaguanine synthase
MIKISEIFGGTGGSSPTLQGEGKYAGVPSIFIRTFGCNHRCPGFGLPAGTTENEEVKEYIKNIPIYKNILEMPIAKTGCDTYMAVYPEFKNFAPKMSIDEIVADVVGRVNPNAYERPHIVITGGEPLLPGWQKEFIHLLNGLMNSDIGFSDFTFETNATQELNQFLSIYIKKFTDIGVNILFSMSPKLSCSGENPEDAIKPDVINSYFKAAPNSYLKFVVGNQEDVDEVFAVLKKINNRAIPVYLMPVGGASVEFTEKDVYDLARKNGFRYSPRLQVSIAGNGAGV